jgi:hypothetical protein
VHLLQWTLISFQIPIVTHSSSPSNGKEKDTPENQSTQAQKKGKATTLGTAAKHIYFIESDKYYEGHDEVKMNTPASNKVPNSPTTS